MAILYFVVSINFCCDLFKYLTSGGIVLKEEHTNGRFQFLYKKAIF